MSLLAGNSRTVKDADVHWGYGFPIGGVAATRVKDGVVSPGGVGFDINCGVRLLRTNLTIAEVKPKIDKLVNSLFVNIPSGLGSEGKIRVSQRELNEVMVKGSRWAVEKGYGEASDIEVTEENGRLKNANPEKVSPGRSNGVFPSWERWVLATIFWKSAWWMKSSSLIPRTRWVSIAKGKSLSGYTRALVARP